MRFLRVAIAVGALALVQAAPSGASMSFGADLSTGDAGQPCGCTSSRTFTNETGAYDGQGGVAVIVGNNGASAAAPAGGVIVSYSVRLSQQVTGRLRVMTIGNPQSSDVQNVAFSGTSPTQTVPGDSTTHTYTVHLPVTQGQVIGFQSTQDPIVRSATGAGRKWRVYKGGSDGSSGQSEMNMDPTIQEALQPPISAVVEPDADGDTFGDETQDQCVGTAGTDNGCVPQEQPPGGGGPGPGGNEPPADTVAPVLSSFALSRTRFVAANTGPAVTVAAAVGTDVDYRDSEASLLTLTFERKTTGVKKKGKCVAGTTKKRKKRCSRYAPVHGSVEYASAAGLNAFRFMGRVGHKSLKPGKYRLTAVARDAAGNASKPVRKSFTVKRA